MENNVSELHTKCNYCKRDILEGMLFFKHPKYGIVCERCDPFKYGGIVPIDEE